ncbi:MAG: cytochrome c biogenesis CcdA family protein [Bacillota bacterium]
MDAILNGLSHPVGGPLYALLAGILTSASPCALAALPLVFGHMAGSTRKSRVADLAWFIAGLALALTLAGIVAGALGMALILTAPWVRWVAGLGFILGGASYLGLFGARAKCEMPLAGAGTTLTPTPTQGTLPRPLSGAMMGALYGVSASPCSTPALLAILAMVAATGSIARGAVLLLFYSLGQSVLVASAGLATSAMRGTLESARGLRALETLRKAGGAVIILFGLYILARPYL